MDTYRTLANVMGYVDMRDSIPEWARRYAVGETIYFEAPAGFAPYLRDGELTTGTVVGFSSRNGFEGLPVVVSSSNGRPIPIPEHRHVEPAVGGRRLGNE